MVHVDLSVIVPIYNVEDYIGKTIKSLKKQKDESVEFLLINDGSTDNTATIIKSEVGNDSRFKLITTENKGVSAARNLGVEVSSGDYIIFLDADDYFYDGALSKLYIEAINTGADITYGRMKRFNSSKIWDVKGHVEANLYEAGVKNILENPELFRSIGPGAKLYKKELIEQIFFPEEIKFGEDQVVTFYTYIKAEKIVCIDELIYMYRVRETNDSSTQTIKANCINYLSDLIVVTKLNLKNIEVCKSYKDDEKIKILINYFERLLQFEMYPILKSGLKNKKAQNESILLVNTWINLLPQEVKNGMTGITKYLLADMNKYLFMVRKKNSKSLEKLNDSFNNISDYYQSELLYRKKFINHNNIFTLFMKLKLLIEFLGKKYTIGNKLSSVIFFLTKVLPKKKKTVVVATSKDFSANENLKYIYETICLNTNLDVRVLDNFNEGFYENWKKYYLLSRAKVIVVDDYFYPLYRKKISRSQYYVQLWHAAGAYKKFAYSAISARQSNSLEFEKKAHQQYTHIVASSEDVGKIYAQAFNHPKEKIKTIGFPRTDILYNFEYRKFIKDRFSKLYPELSDKKIILYAPTFRGGETERVNFKSKIDWEKVKIPIDTIVLVKYHPLIKKTSQYDNEQIVDVSLQNEFTILDFLIISDVMITDYSSVIFDYSLLNKPQIMYLSDIDDYVKERGFYYPIETYSYGAIAYNEIELSELINNTAAIKVKTDEQKEFVRKFMSSCDGKSSEKFNQLLIDLTR